MSHDRQIETLRAVTAIKKIDFGTPTKIVVSDNPSTEENIVQGLPADVEHIVRFPCVSSNEHLSLIWKDFSYEWTLLTHDDDELLPALGDYFRENSHKPEVTLITGLSRIISPEGSEIRDSGYESRLIAADLYNQDSQTTNTLHNYLFDLGSLFPASAMIIKNGTVDFSVWNNDYALAGDIAHSLKASLSGTTCFQGKTPIMNYYLHGGNSVYTSGAAGGLMSDFCITRFDFLIQHPNWASPKRKIQLSKASLAARILAKSFHLTSRYENVKEYSKRANKTTGGRAVFRIAMIPLYLGPLQPLVRYLMWRRLGVRRVKL
jgi:hypothetical protein